ncbi:MAG: lysylphosphatidylglycerol synthase transmembrane domain-containing protein, partial [Blastocatellia bacterium]
DTPVRALLRATVIGFTALFLVGRAGEMIVRPAALSVKEPVKPSASYATVMIERVFDMVMVVVFFSVNLVFFELPARDDESIHRLTLIRVTGLLLLLAAAAGIYGLSIFRKKRAGVIGFLERKLQWLPRRVYEGLINLLKHISDGLAVLHDLKSLAITVSYTVLLWSMVVAGYSLVLRAFDITSSQVPLTGVVFVMALSMIGSVVPSPAAATGPFHAATAASLVFLGVERNDAASAAIVLHLVIFLPAVFFGFGYLLKDGISLARLLHAGEEPAATGVSLDAEPSPEPARGAKKAARTVDPAAARSVNESDSLLRIAEQGRPVRRGAGGA